MTDAGEPQSVGLAALLAVQDDDLAADRVRHRAEHHELRARLAELDARRAGLARRRVSLEAERAELDKRAKTHEREISSTESRAAAIDERLRSTSAGSFRDQEAMAGELDALAKRIHELEDEELAVMELLEPIELELEQIAAEDAAIESEITEQAGALRVALDQLRGELAEIEARRAEDAAPLREGLLAEYEQLRAHLGGVGVARVLHGTCSGCNLALSATELDRLRHAGPESLSHCEQCGRILVP